jgi:glucose-1-phosphate thymidylyltransferase
MRFAYAEQPEPRGLAEAFIIGREFIGDDTVCLILGDNIFFGHGLPTTLREAAKLSEGAVIFAYPKCATRSATGWSSSTRRARHQHRRKAKEPRSNYAVPGIYFYDQRVVEYAANLQPSKRGELEITDINRIYLQQNELQVQVLGRGVAWLDAGTHERCCRPPTLSRRSRTGRA